MPRTRRNFTDEFKREAVKLVKQPGAMATLNRPVFELTPRSWTNFKGLHEEVKTELSWKWSKAFWQAKAA